MGFYLNKLQLLQKLLRIKSMNYTFLIALCGFLIMGTSSEDCTEKAREIMAKAQGLMNEGIDSNNADLQAGWNMPGMMQMPGMEDLLQKHYKFTGIVSCKSTQQNDGTEKIELEVNGTQGEDPTEHTCRIVLGKDGDSLRVIQSQCQGQS